MALLLPDPELVADDDLGIWLVIFLWLLTLPVVLCAFPFVAFKLMRRLAERTARNTAIGIFILATVLALPRSNEDYFINPLLPSLCLALTYLGVGAGLGWAVRRILAQFRILGNLSTKALPLLFLVVMFSFLTAEVWELTDPVGGMDTLGLWLTVGFLLLLGIMFSAAVIRQELRELDRSLAQVEEHRPLAWNERLNVSLILLLSHAFQTMAFVILVFGFFLIFGKLAVSPDVIENWVGNPPTKGSVLGWAVPFSDQLIQISFFLAVFSGLSFTISNATNPSYRSAFFDPLIMEITESLKFRNAYLTRWPESADGR